jgi:threonine synthase
VAALIRLRDRSDVEPGDRVVMILTGCGIKCAPPPLPAPVHLQGSDEEILARVRQSLGA